jgi:hypothetical protein
MKKTLALMGGLALVAASAAAQTGDQQIKESRYQIGQMERVLEGAVEHGAAVMRDRLRSVFPADVLLTENARARGFRLEGFGMLFDVEVPSMQGSSIWSFRVLDQNDLGLQSALNALRSHIEAAGDANLQQALRRVELQVEPMNVAQSVPAAASARPANGAPATTAADSAPADSPLADPTEAYRTEIREALMDAMLEHSRGLSIGPDEWLVIAARGIYDRPPLAPADTDAQTTIIRVRGNDLTAFLGGQISHDEARKRMEVKVF